MSPLSQHIRKLSYKCRDEFCAKKIVDIILTLCFQKNKNIYSQTRVTTNSEKVRCKNKMKTEIHFSNLLNISSQKFFLDNYSFFNGSIHLLVNYTFVFIFLLGYEGFSLVRIFYCSAHS